MVPVRFVASSLYWLRAFASTPVARERIETTSFPPKEVSPPITPSKRNPASAASLSSFSMVEEARGARAVRDLHGGDGLLPRPDAVEPVPVVVPALVEVDLARPDRRGDDLR